MKKNSRYSFRKRYLNDKIHSKDRLRLSVARSLNNIYAQVIDDNSGKTVAAASSLQKFCSDQYGGNCSAAKLVGKKLAELSIAAGVKKVFFDRGKLPYHGRLKALAEEARKGGLIF